MDFTYAILLLIVGVVAFLAGQFATKKASVRKAWMWVTGITVILGVVAILGVIPQLDGLNNQVNFGGETLAIVDEVNAGSNTFYQPTATYATLNAFTGASVSGTAYMISGNGIAKSGTLSSVNEGTKYTYWVSNASSIYVQPLTFTASSGSNDITNTNAYTNSSATITLFDVLGNQNVQNGIANASMGAGDSVTIDLKYKGTFQGSAMPFGGVMVVETNSTITSISCTGDDVSATVPYSKVSYTVQATADTYQTFGIAPSLDDGSGTTNVISCTFKNGATDTSSPVYWTFIPANYYKTQSGQIVLDVQKSADDSTTRTALGQVTATNYFS